MSAPGAFKRHLEARLVEALQDAPVVLLHGPRQSGKTTLARTTCEPLGYAYFTFDDLVVKEAAEQDPVGFIDDLPEHVILDEVQRVPALFLALKSAVDRRRASGRFVLTGSANVLLLPKLADSLAGRMEVLRLHPLCQAELEGRPPRFLDRLFDGNFKTAHSRRMGSDLTERLVAGGYPVALTRRSTTRRSKWYRDYIDALVERDVRDLARIGALDVVARLLAVAATQTARLFNASDLASPFQLSRPTIRDYVTLLERVFLLELVPPWHTNRLSRAVKTPKLHLGDTGVAAALLGLSAKDLAGDREARGQLLETFVFQELRRQASAHEESHAFFHFRDRDGVEVDVVIERGARRVVGVEVKSGATVTQSDFRGLRKLQALAGNRFQAGVVLFDGETTVGFGDRMFAVPVAALWAT